MLCHAYCAACQLNREGFSMTYSLIRRLYPLLLTLAVLFTWCLSAALAAPPVRIAVVPGSGSGQEQSAVDGITAALEGNPSITLSTVNPDWYVVCNIIEQTDTVSGTVKVNGTVTIKTTDGQILNTISVQTNKSDFSLQPGAPLNKALVNRAVEEVIAGMAQRAVPPIQSAVDVEIATRDRIIQAHGLADREQYDEAIQLLLPITPDTPHFKGVRALIDEFRSEKLALERLKQAEALRRSGQYAQAIKIAGGIGQKSRYAARSRALIAALKAAMAGRRPAVRTSASTTPTSKEARLKALEAQERALEHQRKAIEQQRHALLGK